MKKKIILGLCSMITIGCVAQTPDFEWVKASQGTNSEACHTICTDPFGNVIATGSYQGTVDFDPGIGTLSLSTNGLDDVFVQKLNAEGSLDWTVSFGGYGYDFGHGVATDASGNVYVCGHFSSFMDINPGSEEQLVFSNGVTDIYVLKLNADGQLLWYKTIGGSEGDYALDLAVSTTGDVYVTGSFISTGVDFDPGEGIALHSSQGNQDIYVLKLDTNGGFEWATTFGSEGTDRAEALVTDEEGNVYVTGVFSETMDVDPSEEVNTITAVGEGDVFVEKLTSDGDLVWVQSFGGTDYESAHGIAVNADNEVFTSGFFTGTADFDPGMSNYELTVNGGGGALDAFVQKLDANGDFLWAHHFGGSLLDQVNDMVCDVQGNVYLTGLFQGTVDFDPSDDEWIAVDQGGKDIFVLRYDGDGNFSWMEHMGGSLLEQGRSIALDETGNIFVGGSFTETVDFDPSYDQASISPVGLDDAFIFKFSQRLVDLTEEDSSFIVYPNPTSGPVYLSFDTAEEIQIRLFDTKGQLLKQYTNYASMDPISFPFAKGVYFLWIKTFHGDPVVKKIHRM